MMHSMRHGVGALQDKFIVFGALICAVLLWQPLGASALELKGRVSAELAAQGPVWVGQGVRVNLDLWTTGFVFSEQRFDVPEIFGVLVFKPETSVGKFTKTERDETWQIMRYELLLYPQRAGQLDIPPVNISFKSSAGYGMASRTFEDRSQSFRVKVAMPEGVPEGAALVTTTNLEVLQKWEPESETSKVGDAFKLTLTVRAADFSGMALPVLPVPELAGVAVYSEEPRIRDSENRGDLLGERVDVHTFVFQKAGRYEIPGVIFYWWHPQKKQLEKRNVAAIAVEVKPNPALKGGASEPDQSFFRSPEHIMGRLVIFILAALVSYKAVKRLAPRWRAWHVRRTEREIVYFKHLLSSCRANNPVEAYNRMTRWLLRLKTEGRGVSLDWSAGIASESDLNRALEQLQMAVALRDSTWSGVSLAAALPGFRRILLERGEAHAAGLGALNPMTGRLGR